MAHCPGQDIQFWKPEDIFEVDCPNCKSKVEFWKDDISRRCRKCGHKFRNPKLNLGCAEWCQYAKYCLGRDVEQIKKEKNLPCEIDPEILKRKGEPTDTTEEGEMNNEKHRKNRE